MGDARWTRQRLIVCGTVERENAAVGVLITLEEATGPMRREAADAGFFEARGIGNVRVPRIQILTIEELLNGGRIELPAQTVIRSTRQAPRARRAGPRERELFEQQEQVEDWQP